MLLHRSSGKWGGVKSSQREQVGVVIVVALFIVAMVASMAYVMLAHLDRDIRRTSMFLHDVEAEEYAEGSLLHAVEILRQNWQQRKPGLVIDRTPIKTPSRVMNGYQISSTIYDMQARYNLNNLTSPEAVQALIRLLRVVAPQLGVQKTQEIAAAISKRVKKKPMTSIGELRLVPGVDATLFSALQPYLIALPQVTQVSIQNADPVVLMTEDPGLTIETARAIAQEIKQRLPALPAIKNRHLKVIEPQYFMIETEVSIEKQRLVMYSLVQRSTKVNKAEVNILWQSKGTW